MTNTKEGEVHHAGGTATITYSECMVSAPEKCVVKEPIVAETNAKTWEKGEEMGVEFTAKGENFTEIVLENKGAEKCGVKGTFPIKGSVIGTPGNTFNGKGATLYFKENEAGKTAMQNLKFGAAEASYTGVETIEMKEKEPTTGNAITLTTVK